ncbi:hypothetical protein B0H63DRAFT_467231 [Podospora didyma]|uniref:Cut9-interacting protein scn1 n=1 Tax=Podospora didyma TaxID=330526 RepID=A0AAE0U4U2_9PEZI|nr:hypothetical protein B0H63DRAFT_467231 [Podospora didyma]
MCPPTDGQAPSQRAGELGFSDDFPWHVGVCDAHCHPTDTMASIASVGGMRARVLTIMATRSQDQELVAAVAADHGVTDQGWLSSPPSPSAGQAVEKVVPAFGWHPWFSYQFYDDDAAESTSDLSEAAGARKAKHYTAVLSPVPDADFISSLPEPQPLSGFIAETRQRLLAHPAAIVGEIGLDKAFRLPWGTAKPSEREEGLTPGGREGRMLSPYHVKMPHQVQVLKTQLRLAGELGRPVSVHGVQAHGVLYDAISSLWKGHEKEVVSRRKQKMVAAGAEDFSSSEDEDEDFDWGAEGDTEPQRTTKSKALPKPYEPKPFPPRICLHSFSGPVQMLKQYLNPAIPARIFFSCSMVVNLATAGGESKFADVIRACPDDQLLVESDLHTAGDEMDLVLEQMYTKVCQVKGWTLLEGVERIRNNYRDFIFG